MQGATQRAQRFFVIQVRSGVFPLFELRDADTPTAIDYSQDREEMLDLAEAMNTLDQRFNGGAA